MLKIALAFSLAAILTGCNLVNYQVEETLTLSVEDITALDVNHDEGDVRLSGEEGLDEIIVDVKYEVIGEEMSEAEAFFEDNLSISLEKDDDIASLVTSIRRGSNIEQGKINLTIRIPADLPVHYRQKEGYLDLKNVQSNLNIQHGSGAVTLTDVVGDVRLTDGAGSVTFERVTGDLQLNINAGTTSITESSGLINLTTGSGDVNISEHTGSIQLRSGSGNVKMTNIDGDVEVLGARGDRLELEDITGEVITP